MPNSGIHVKCFMMCRPSQREIDIDAWLEQLVKYPCMHSTLNKSQGCLNEITAVQEVLKHLKEFDQSHMEHLVMASCDGRLIARGQRFINEVLKYALVREQRAKAAC